MKIGANKTDAGNGSKAICRVSDVLRSPSPDPKRSPPSMSNIADIIFDRRAPNAQPEWIADILSRLVWLMADNGAEIHEAYRRWIQSDDLERISVALSDTEVFLFDSRDEMTKAFSDLGSRFPTLVPRCEEIIGDWDRQHSVSTHAC